MPTTDAVKDASRTARTSAPTRSLAIPTSASTPVIKSPESRNGGHSRASRPSAPGPDRADTASSRNPNSAYQTDWALTLSTTAQTTSAIATAPTPAAYAATARNVSRQPLPVTFIATIATAP